MKVTNPKRRASAWLAVCVILFASCALFQKDPVGASLLTIKEGYEASVRTAGRLYINRLIQEDELRKFRDEASKFYVAYTAVVALHEAGKLPPGDARVDQLRLGLNALETLLNAFLAKEGT